MEVASKCFDLWKKMIAQYSDRTNEDTLYALLVFKYNSTDFLEERVAYLRNRWDHATCKKNIPWKFLMIMWGKILNKYQGVKEFHLLAPLKHKIPHFNPTKRCLLLELNGKQSEYLKVNIL